MTEHYKTKYITFRKPSQMMVKIRVLFASQEGGWFPRAWRGPGCSAARRSLRRRAPRRRPEAAAGAAQRSSRVPCV